MQTSPIMLTRHGKPVGVLLSVEEYKRLRQAEVLNQVIEISRHLRESGVSASELHQASRRELAGEE